jgi:hypothetical protein
MKEEQSDYGSIVIETTVRGINVVRKNYSTYIVKKKKINNWNHFKI